MSARVLWWWLALGLLAFSSTHAGDAATPDVKLSIAQLLRTQQDAWNRHDLEGFMAGYWNSPDLTFFSGVQRTSGWQGALDRYRRVYQGEGKEMGKLEFSGFRSSHSDRTRPSWAALGTSPCPMARRPTACSRSFFGNSRTAGKSFTTTHPQPSVLDRPSMNC